MKQETGFKKYGGMLLTLIASLCFAAIILFAKLLRDYKFDAYGAAFWRYVGITIPAVPLLVFYECGPWSKKERGSVFQTVWPVFKNDNWKSVVGLLSRGLIGSTNNILRYCALQYLTIGDTLVITYASPIFVTFMAHYFLNEKCGIVPLIIAFTTLVGVVIVTKPPILTGAEAFDNGTLIGCGLAFASLFLSSISVIITRKLRDVHFALMTLTFGVIGLLESIILALTWGHLSFPVGLYDSLYVSGVAGLSFVGMMTIVLALKFENAGPVTLIRSCDVIFGFVLQFLFLNVVPDIYSSIGAFIVLFGVFMTGFRKYLITLPDGDGKRSTWSWVMK